MYYLRQSRGVHVGTSQIVIGAGIENLLFLLSLTLGKGRTMAMENPAYLNAYQTVRELGFQVLPINMDEEGLKVSQLEQSGADSRLCDACPPVSNRCGPSHLQKEPAHQMGQRKERTVYHRG